MADSKQLERQHSVTGAVVSFHNINYEVPVKAPGKPCGTVQKHILRNISGMMKPGMNAIMGPTGSGKSSLLDVLAGRKDPRGLTGDVLVDGKQQPKNFKCMSGYVVQDDVVMGTLTVRENFMFSANLRLPTSVTTEEKEKIVQNAVFELGLTHCADSKVGTEFIRGVSGGERKRCNVGMELIISPSVLFLDEPTTGLDASTANAVLLILHRLSRRGRTVVFSIHQPRYSIFRLFDRLTLLSLGNTVYHGPSDDALQFFSSVGYQCEPHNNPPDFFLDVINGDSTAVQNTDAMEANTVENPNEKTTNGAETNGFQNATYVSGGQITLKLSSSGTVRQVSSEDGDPEVLIEVAPKEGESEKKLCVVLSEKFNESQWNAELKSELDPIYEHYKQNKDEPRARGEYATGFFTQLRYVCGRTVLNIIRNPATSVIQILVTVVFALITGIIYLQLDNDLDSGIQNRTGVFFFVCMNQVFSNLSAVEVFIKERAIFIHENASGFYRVSTYFLSKIFCDLIPLRLVPVVIYSLIAYFMIGLSMPVEKLFIFMFILLCLTLSAASVGFLMSSTVRIFAIANLLVALIYVFSMVFGGLLVNVSSLGDWISWLKYLSIFRYGLNALSINELKGMEFCSTVNETSFCDPNAGNHYLDLQGIAHDTAWDLWQNMVGLICIFIGVMILTYIQLRRIPKLK